MTTSEPIQHRGAGNQQLSLNLGLGLENYVAADAIQSNPSNPGDFGQANSSISGLSGSESKLSFAKRLRWGIPMRKPDAAPQSDVQLEQLHHMQQAMERNQQQLQDELAQVQALNRQQTKRIHHLEQALDQALGYLEDLRRRVQDQKRLEEQLAITEEYANVQQQAISRLKQQLTEQANGVHPPAHDDGYFAASSPSSSYAATRIDSYSLSSEFAGDLAKVIAAAQAHIEALNTEIEERTTYQARLQHACQEVTTERDQLLNRMTTLEQQNAELQEQILKQMKQISDYETGLRHWKDRYAALQHQVDQYQRLLHHADDSCGSPEATEAETSTASEFSSQHLDSGPATPNQSEPPQPHSASSQSSESPHLPEFLRRLRGTNRS